MDLILYSTIEEHVKRQAERCLLSSKNAPSTYKSLIDTDNKYLPMKDRILVQTRNKIKTHLIFWIHAKGYQQLKLKDYLFNSITILLTSKSNQCIVSIRSFLNLNIGENRKEISPNVNTFIENMVKTKHINHAFLDSEDLIGRTTSPTSLYDEFVSAASISNNYLQFIANTYMHCKNAYKTDKYVREPDLSKDEQSLFTENVRNKEECTFFMKICKRNTLNSTEIIRTVYVIETAYTQNSITKPYDDHVACYIAHTIEHSFSSNPSNNDITPLTLCFVRCIPNHRFFGKCAFLDAWATSSVMNTVVQYMKESPFKSCIPFPVKYGSISLYRTLFEIYTLGYEQIVAEVVIHYDPNKLLRRITPKQAKDLDALKALYENIGFEHVGSVETVTYDYTKYEKKNVQFRSERLRPGEDIDVASIFASNYLDEKGYTQRSDLILMRLALTREFIMNKCIPNLMTGEVEGVKEDAVVKFLTKFYHKKRSQVTE